MYMYFYTRYTCIHVCIYNIVIHYNLLCLCIYIIIIYMYLFIHLFIYIFIYFICTLYPTWIPLLLNFLAENPRSSNCRNNRVQNWGSIHQQHLRPVEIADAAQLVLHHHLEKGPAVPKKPVLVQGDSGVGVDRRSEILTCKRCSGCHGRYWMMLGGTPMA